MRFNNLNRRHINKTFLNKVKAIILAPNMSMGLSERINGKSTYYASIGMARA